MSSIIEGGRWNAKEPMELICKENVFSLSGDGFEIKAHNGRNMFKVEGHAMSMRDRKTMHAADGTIVAELREKAFSLHKGQDVVDREGHFIFTVRKAGMIQMVRSNLEIYLGDGDREIDFEVKGDFLSKSFKITKKSTGKEVANISRKGLNASNMMFGADTYVVSVPTGGDMAFAVLVAIAADEIYQE
uniref:Tubby C-terminal domain-containing protein n=1 Tax=Compsopogon caeruleus TaxID=31354 RepID=A0A7S1T6V1_9RHOD|mmetsp:Transcript_11927/g.24295  ORF Transcript_11927/g.24295 Transcript_11927/m.24295 type:complete len:188 (+) Transcript_11927:159-722(+)|eukprot:CAMPEP_0184682396 /NCGR_PEP_ID=MMETSP0312-20130426/7113_1 /TAXON_ID=31354 /ORGANISM="Compsopogon coeruleus, Strain SAG 36.94" /LENGTH=187 /DNA_ID=CAMNT_0027134027 /DNA_START=88 /DNA_END=651 /DNA_ORIENTATION=+